MMNHNRNYRANSHFPYSLSFLITVVFVLGCQSPDKKATHLTFAFGPDDAGTVAALIEVFNNQNNGEIKVDWKVASRSTDEFYQQIASDFSSNQPSMDIIASDVVWTSALASKGWLSDISKEFFESYAPRDFVPAAMNTVSHDFRIWGVPWFSDAGILFYRKDLLAKYGYDYPPTTWKELVTVAKDISSKEGLPYGYVFQGADYEGGVTNACEFIWAGGGSILLNDMSLITTGGHFWPEYVTINSNEALAGLEAIDHLMDAGITPTNSHEFKELDAMNAFMDGQSVFMRNWASAYGQFDTENSKLSLQQVGMTPLPSIVNSRPSYSCLGGWNLVVGSHVSPEKRAAALKFIEFMTSEESQQYRLVEGSVLPSRQKFYTDQTLMAESPVLALANQVMPICRERPQSPHYVEFSPVIAQAFNKLVKREFNAGEVMMYISVELSGKLAEKR